MPSTAIFANAAVPTLLPSADRVAGLVRITTATTGITGVRWIVFA
jgi:hypothetical protein